jgi:hypothetical protein
MIMKIYLIDFIPCWPVGNTFTIKAESEERAKEIAINKLKEYDPETSYTLESEEIDMSTEGIIYTSGDY